MMRRYAEHAGCRRSFLLTYFGQSYDGPCGRCDNDRLGPAAPDGAEVFPVGERVVSKQWGEGTVQRYNGDQVTVLFDEHGYRDLLVPLVAERRLLRRKDDPGVGTPLMLATLTDRRDFGDDWLLERKFDGERCVARKDGDDVRLESRTGKDLTGTYPEVRGGARGAASRPAHAGRRGRRLRRRPDSFGRLQQRLGVRPAVPALVAGTRSSTASSTCWRRTATDLTALPLVERRARLEGDPAGGGLQISEAWRGESERRFAEACRPGWEGLIAKRADAPYIAGPLAGLAEAQVRRRAGARDRRLHRARPAAAPTSARCSSATTRTASSGTPARSAPATAPRSCRARGPAAQAGDARARRSSTPGRCRAARTGAARSSWRRSGSPSGRRRVGCASRASSACATTRRRRMSSASSRARQ